MREWSIFESSIASVVDRRIEFGGQVYRPNSSLAFLDVKMCHSLPILNSKKRGWTAATLANSFETAQNQLVDFEHRLAFYAQASDEQDRIIGTIAAVEYPDKKKAIALSEKGEAVPIRALLAMYRKAQNVDKTLKEIASDIKWRVSMECEYAIDEAALWDGKKFHPYGKASDEMKALVHPSGVDRYDGKEISLILGGEDGNVLFSGIALTLHPADKSAEIESMAASEKVMVINCGWKNDNDRLQAVASNAVLPMEEQDFAIYGGPSDEKLPANVKKMDSKKRSQWVGVWNSAYKKAKKEGMSDTKAESAAFRTANGVLKNASAEANEQLPLISVKGKSLRKSSKKSEKAGDLFIGFTDAGGDGHTHPILSDMTIMPVDGHSHYVKSMDIELDTPSVQGVTGTHVAYDGSSYIEHAHTFQLGAKMRSDKGAKLKKEDGPMKRIDVAKYLREKADSFKDTDEELAKEFTAKADAIEKEVAAEDTETVIAARIASGDLVPKAKVEASIVDAKTAGKKELEAEIAAKAKSEQEKADALKNRTEKVKASGIDLAFVLGKDKTIQSVVASMPVGADGDKMFEERLEEWTALKRATGQASATGNDGKGKEAILAGGAAAKSKNALSFI
jgi:hypothetical protein